MGVQDSPRLLWAHQHPVNHILRRLLPFMNSSEQKAMRVFADAIANAAKRAPKPKPQAKCGHWRSILHESGTVECLDCGKQSG